ncbi:MAG TPA: metalloregulator ArsR/SmtB family transcription factor [Burkholderiales bacterium]|nr:metalloregulator ArsR/SmtB family transcription factor [Burkholderiales bacterium]
MMTVNVSELQAKALMVTRLLKAMANPSRLLVLCQLAGGEKSVGELECAVGLSQSALSQHLAVLRHENIATTRRAGQNIFYLLSSTEAAAIMHTLYKVFCSKAAKKAARNARMKARKPEATSVRRFGHRSRETA